MEFREGILFPTETIVERCIALNDLTNLSLGDAGIIAVTGICFVFAVLALLLAILYISGAIFQGIANKQAAKAAAAAAEVPAAPASEPVKAPEAKGSCGDMKLYDVAPREAAMVMAIIADETKTPLNQLRFKSIKKVNKEETK